MTPLDRISQLMAENTALRADLARVKAERDAKAEECHEVSAHAAKAMEDRDALRACVADWKKCADLAESALASEQQLNAELEAALREEKRIHPEDFQQGDFRERALAAAARKQRGAQ